MQTNRFYIVAITAKGYKVVDVRDSDVYAVASLLRARGKYLGTSFVLRHGSTGKRETVAEVMARTKVAA